MWFRAPRRVRPMYGSARFLVTSSLLAAVVAIPPATFRTFPNPWSGGVGGRGVLTPDDDDSYRYTSSSGTMDAAALPSNRSANLRAVFWPSHAVAARDQQSCATWASESTWRAQQGAALRVDVERSGAIHAITVTKNVWYGATWIFNVHVWNSATVPALRQVGVFNLERVFRGRDGLGVPLPWRLCARVVGDVLDFKVWRLPGSEPAWGDATHGGRVSVPMDAPRSGFTGWYIGHLPAGGSASFTGLGTWSLPSGASSSRLASALAARQSRAIFGSVSAPGSSIVIRQPTGVG